MVVCVSYDLYVMICLMMLVVFLMHSGSCREDRIMGILRELMKIVVLCIVTHISVFVWVLMYRVSVMVISVYGCRATANRCFS